MMTGLINCDFYFRHNHPALESNDLLNDLGGNIFRENVGLKKCSVTVFEEYLVDFFFLLSINLSKDRETSVHSYFEEHEQLWV